MRKNAALVWIVGSRGALPDALPDAAEPSAKLRVLRAPQLRLRIAGPFDPKTPTVSTPPPPPVEVLKRPTIHSMMLKSKRRLCVCAQCGREACPLAASTGGGGGGGGGGVSARDVVLLV